MRLKSTVRSSFFQRTGAVILGLFLLTAFPVLAQACDPTDECCDIGGSPIAGMYGHVCTVNAMPCGGVCESLGVCAPISEAINVTEVISSKDCTYSGTTQHWNTPLRIDGTGALNLINGAKLYVTAVTIDDAVSSDVIFIEPGSELIIADSAVINCSDECLFGAERCGVAGDEIESCAEQGDGDICFEWGTKEACPDNKCYEPTCTEPPPACGETPVANGDTDEACFGNMECDGSGNCVCISHATKDCSGGDVYWYDGCGNQEELFEDCFQPTQMCQGNYPVWNVCVGNAFITYTCDLSGICSTAGGAHCTMGCTKKVQSATCCGSLGPTVCCYAAGESGAPVPGCYNNFGTEPCPRSDCTAATFLCATSMCCP